jgi:hypothetical protein
MASAPSPGIQVAYLGHLREVEQPEASELQTGLFLVLFTKLLLYFLRLPFPTNVPPMFPLRFCRT